MELLHVVEEVVCVAQALLGQVGGPAQDSITFEEGWKVRETLQPQAR